MTTYADRVRDTSTTSGTANIVLDGAPPEGYQSWAEGFDDTSATVAYCMALADQWEVGYGAFNGTTGITRLAANVLDGSSGPGVLVDFAAGTKDVFCTAPAAVIEPDVIDASIVPRAQPRATLLLAAGYENELALDPDTNLLYKMTGVVGGAAQINLPVSDASNNTVLGGAPPDPASSGASDNYLVGGSSLAETILFDSANNNFALCGDILDISFVDNCTLIGRKLVGLYPGLTQIGEISGYPIECDGFVTDCGRYGSLGTVGANIGASHMRLNTANATPTVMVSSQGTSSLKIAGGPDPVFWRIEIFAHVVGSITTNYARFVREFVASDANIVGAIVTPYADSRAGSLAALTLPAIAFSGNSLNITCTGIAATNIRWFAVAEFKRTFNF